MITCDYIIVQCMITVVLGALLLHHRQSNTFAIIKNQDKNETDEYSSNFEFFESDNRMRKVGK